MTATAESQQVQPSWGLRDAIGSLAAFMLLSLGVGGGLVLLGADSVTATLAGTIAGWLALGGWPLIATRRRGNGARVDLDVAFRPVDLGYGLLAAFVVLGASMVFVLVYVTVVGEVPTSTFGEAAESATVEWQIAFLGLFALGAAFVEELHFRGLWWNALRRRGLGRWPTLVLTAVLFGVVHLELARMPLLIAAGLAAGFVRILTGRLGPAIVAHLVINGIGTIGLWSLL